jgi:hypothetical protein
MSSCALTLGDRREEVVAVDDFPVLSARTSSGTEQEQSGIAECEALAYQSFSELEH